MARGLHPLSDMSELTVAVGQPETIRGSHCALFEPTIISSPAVRFFASILLVWVWVCDIPQAVAQETKATADASAEEPPTTEVPADKIEVKPTSRDSDIEARLRRILEATEWFENPQVKVTEGVVFLEGTTATNERKDWAGKLASNTRDVVAVANRMKVAESSIWDFSPAWAEIDTMRRHAIQSLPVVMVALLILLLTWFSAKGFSLVARRIVSRRTENPLLKEVLVKALTIPVILFGIYFALRVTGLTRLAATVLGGTGILGLILGIAFRDIAENFLASLLISMQRPFRAGDSIVVEGRTGTVQAVTTRGTTIMTPDGNHVRIPNSIIYKSVIENQTANPRQRTGFTLSIDAKKSLAASQSAVLEAVRHHEAVLTEPEPLVLVHRLGRNSAILQVYFWLDVRKHSKDKVTSALTRLAKIALEGILEQPSSKQGALHNGEGNPPSAASDRLASTPAEGTLQSDVKELQKQARDSRPIEEGTDLLKTGQKGTTANVSN